MATAHHRSSGVGREGSPQLSSASGLSSPPRSSPEASPSNQVTSEANTSATTHSSSITVNPAGVQEASAEKPARKKPGRKPGYKNPPKPGAEVLPANTGAEAPKQRRPRKLKDPNAPPPQRKRKPKESLESANGIEIMTGMGMGLAGPPPPADPAPTFQIPAPTQNAPQKGKSEDIQRSIQSFFNSGPPPIPQNQQPPPPPPPARTSGQNYDPIRSNYDPVRETVVIHGPYSPNHPQSMNRASASPSISSLVDPPNHPLASPSVAAQSFFNQQQRLHSEGRASMPASPTVNRLGPSLVNEAPTGSKPPTPSVLPSSRPPTAPPATIPKKMSASSSAAASPKPLKEKATKDVYAVEPPPLPGSGPLGPSDGTESRAPTVILNIPMNGEINKYVNFTRLAEEQYGWDALHPRLAAQRDRLARVAAAGAALERNGSNKDSGDEMSLDSDAENSNVEMGGMSDGKGGTGTDGAAKKVPRKRKMKEDEYDKDDGFVDDSELLWEEQAAAANDGFFVYSGPLVPEGDKPALDTRADGAPKRGRGRGGRARGTGSRGGAAAVATALLGRNGLPLTGPGSRGGSTTRKPRITKADRARMEAEKADREKMGSAMASSAMPSNFGHQPQLASAPQSLGSTPMVFN